MQIITSPVIGPPNAVVTLLVSIIKWILIVIGFFASTFLVFSYFDKPTDVEAKRQALHLLLNRLPRHDDQLWISLDSCVEEAVSDYEKASGTGWKFLCTAQNLSGESGMRFYFELDKKGGLRLVDKWELAD